MLQQTASQTIGPYLAIGLDRWKDQNILTNEATLGERIVLTGQVLDGEGNIVIDAMIEIWQANAAGRHAHGGDTQNKPMDPTFRGFGRCPTDAEGRFRFVTVKPGRVPGRGNALQAPHISLIVFGRGMLSHAYTRAYFDDEGGANAKDPLLGLVEEMRRTTLIAKAATPDTGGKVYEFDIYLQGARETVFLEA